MREESPEKLFKHAVWDAAATIIYIVGALIVRYLLKAFGSEGVPAIVKVGLIAMEVGFVLVAIGFLITAAITVIRNFKRLGSRVQLEVPSCHIPGQ